MENNLLLLRGNIMTPQIQPRVFSLDKPPLEGGKIISDAQFGMVTELTANEEFVVSSLAGNEVTLSVWVNRKSEDTNICLNIVGGWKINESGLVSVDDVETDETIATSQWYQFTTVRSPESVRLYINGRFIQSVTKDYGVLTGDLSYTSNVGGACLSQQHVYDSALDSTTIANLYSNGKHLNPLSQNTPDAGKDLEQPQSNPRLGKNVRLKHVDLLVDINNRLSRMDREADNRSKALDDELNRLKSGIPLFALAYSEKGMVCNTNGSAFEIRLKNIGEKALTFGSEGIISIKIPYGDKNTDLADSASKCGICSSSVGEKLASIKVNGNYVHQYNVKEVTVSPEEVISFKFGTVTPNQLPSLVSILIEVAGIENYQTQTFQVLLEKVTRDISSFVGGSNIGIGTSSPNSKLEVTGDIKSLGKIEASRNIESAGDVLDKTGYVMPSGGIIMWSGATNGIPAGWRLCNGSYNTPDLRDRFIMGAGGSYSPGKYGEPDRHRHYVTIPSRSGWTDSRGNHDHSLNSSWYKRNFDSGRYSGIDVSGDSPTWWTRYNGSHKHHISFSSQGTYTGYSSDLNRPKWYALCFIMKM